MTPARPATQRALTAFPGPACFPQAGHERSFSKEEYIRLMYDTVLPAIPDFACEQLWLRPPEKRQWAQRVQGL